MAIDTLDELKAAFQLWRQTKRFRREATPQALLDRARRAVNVHGLNAVHKATKLERYRLEPIVKTPKAKAPTSEAATFSRISMTAPLVSSSPLVEVEALSGLKLKVFSFTPETVGFLSSLCGVRGGQYDSGTR